MLRGRGSLLTTWKVWDFVGSWPRRFEGVYVSGCAREPRAGKILSGS